MSRQKFTKEFKEEACKMVVEQGQTVTLTAKNLGVGAPMLGRWVREYRQLSTDAFPGEGTRIHPEKRIHELEAQVRRLQMERDILKKAMAYFAEPPK